MIHPKVGLFLREILLDMSDRGVINFRKIISSHNFYQPDDKIISWYGFICKECKYDLDSICWETWDLWSPITCDQGKIKRLLE